MPDLSRFLEAQHDVYATALDELREGDKQTHWMWFIFPQLQVLGRSRMALHYGIAGLAEAKAYLAHPILGPRLIECTQAMLMHGNQSAHTILGQIDALKLRSCLTLFARAAPSVVVFAQTYYFRKFGNITIHTEYTVRYNKFFAREVLMFGQLIC